MTRLRIRCRLLGCSLDEHYQCRRCDFHLYGGGFIERGRLAPLFDWWHWLRRACRHRRCLQCGKSLLFRRTYNGDHCCEKCFNEWIPF